MQVIPQTQFTPLPEALCLVISELNSDKDTASLEVIFTRLQDRFSDMIVPNQDIVYVSLGKLIKDRKVYHTSDGYFIVTPETYHVTTIPTMPERPLLLTNEEAIHRLHGGQLLPPLRASTATRTRSVQTNMDEFSLFAQEKSPNSERNVNSLSRLERSGSLRLSRKEKHKSKEAGDRGSVVVVRSESMRLSPEKSKSLIKDINLKSSLAHQDVEKGEKVSVFSKLFRRSSSKRRKSSKSPAKYATFSSQFPPLEWSDPNIVHYHSRSTQTLDGRRSSSSFGRLLTMGSDSGLVTSARLVDPDHHNHVHRSSMQRPLSSVTISSAAMSNGNGAMPPNHKINDITSMNNNNNNNNNSSSSNNNNNINCAASSSSPPSMKSKTDSLTRLREQHDKFNQHQLRVRSSTLDSVNPADHAVQELSVNSNASASAASTLESRSVAVTPLSPTKTATTTTSGLPVRKIQSHSCIVLQESPSAKRRSSKTRGQSPAASTTPTTTTTAGLKSSPIHVAAATPTRSSTFFIRQTSSTPNSKIVNTDRPSSYIGSQRSSVDVSRMLDEAKVRNTDPRNVDEECKLTSSSKLQNRWSSVHGRSVGETTPASKGTTGTSGSITMNNVTSASKRGTTAAASKNYRYSAFKCVNKLHGGSQVNSSASGKHVTAAVRPTQAIRPLTNEIEPTNDDGDDDVLGGAAAKLAADDKASLTMTPSPSFNKSFDIESSAFKSITAQKLLKGASINSIDTLVEVNMAAERSSDEDSAGAFAAAGSMASCSSSSNGHQDGGASFGRKVLNYIAPVPPSYSQQGKQAGAVQPRVVGEAHKVVPSASQGHDGSLGDVKNPKTANESEPITKVMAVI